MKPAISIVLPVYNGDRFLAGAIRSCLAQTCQDWELIIVDDASTDATGAIARAFAEQDTRVVYARHATNRKLPAALNSGFNVAQGAFLTWISDDNLYRPDALEEMKAYLERRPMIDLVYTDFSLIDEHDNEVHRVMVRPPQSLGFRANCIGASFMFRREVYTGVGGYAEDLFMAEDYYFWICAAMHYRLAALHKDLYQYRSHPQALSQQGFDFYELVRKMHERALARVGESHAVLRAGLLCDLAFSARRRALITEARRYLWQALRLAPISVLLRASRVELLKVVLGLRPSVADRIAAT